MIQYDQKRSTKKQRSTKTINDDQHDSIFYVQKSFDFMHPALDVLDASRSPADMRKDPQTLAGKAGGPWKKTNPEVNATLSASHRYSPLLTKCCYGLRIATACNYSRFHSFTSSYTWHYALHLPCTFPYLSPLRDGFSWRCLAQHFCNFSEQLSPSNTREAS